MTSMFVPAPVISLAVKPKQSSMFANFSKALQRFCKVIEQTHKLHCDLATSILRVMVLLFCCSNICICMCTYHHGGSRLTITTTTTLNQKHTKNHQKTDRRTRRCTWRSTRRPRRRSSPAWGAPPRFGICIYLRVHVCVHVCVYMCI